jgi:hypothetical protein
MDSSGPLISLLLLLLPLLPLLPVTRNARLHNFYGYSTATTICPTSLAKTDFFSTILRLAFLFLIKRNSTALQNNMAAEYSSQDLPPDLLAQDQANENEHAVTYTELLSNTQTREPEHTEEGRDTDVEDLINPALLTEALGHPAVAQQNPAM